MTNSPQTELKHRDGEAWATGELVAPDLAEFLAALERLEAALMEQPDTRPLYPSASSDIQKHLATINNELEPIFTYEWVIEQAIQRAERNGEDSAEISFLFDRLSRVFGHLSELSLEHKPTPIPTAFNPDAISFISARPVIAAMRALMAGNAHWQRPEGQQPYYADRDGVMVYVQEGSDFNPLALDAAWQRVLSLDDSKVSTFLICLGKWLADTAGGARGLTKTHVHVGDILSFRGLKKEPHGGYKKTQKEEAKQDILALNSIWVRSVEKVFIGRGKSENRAIDSRLLEVAIESSPNLFGEFEPFAFRLAPGDWATHYLGEHNRQIATLLRPVMRYDPGKQRFAMRLGIYLATQWRIRAKTENYEQPWSVVTLLNGAFVELPTVNLDRFRQQFEQALDRLQTDNVILGWEYVKDTQLPVRKWFGHWLEWGVKITPVEAAIENYADIPQRRREAIGRGKRAAKAAASRKTSA